MGRTRRWLPLVIAAGLFAAAGSATAQATSASCFTLINADGPGEGFNDPKPVAPVVGNPGRTVGAQRMNVFKAVAWEICSRLGSGVDIPVEVQWDPLDCRVLSGTLASAGPTFVVRGFPGAPRSNTWYSMAQANALSGELLNPGPALSITFNSDVGTSGCLPSRQWHYGIGKIDSRNFNAFGVAMHEWLHGLGFTSLVDLDSGALFQGFTDTYSRNLEDHQTGRRWSGMSDSERKESITRSGDLHWVGPNALMAAASLRAGSHDGSGHPQIYAPDPVDRGSSVSHWDTEVDALTDEVMEPFATPTQGYLLSQQLFQDLGWNINQPSVASLKDFTGNGSVEIAVLRVGSAGLGHKVVVFDSATSTFIRQVPLPANLSAVAIAAIPHFAGSPAGEIGVLAWSPVGNRLLLMIFDAGSGEPLRFWTVPPGQPRALLSLPSFTGAAAWDFALLTYRDGAGARLWILNAANGRMEGMMGFPSSQLPLGMAVVPSFGGTPAPEMAVLLSDPGRRVSELKLRDARSGVLLSRIELADDLAPSAVAAMRSFAGGPAAEVAVLGISPDTGDSRVLVVDAASGETLREHPVPQRVEPKALFSLPDFTGTAADELVVAGRFEDNLRAKFYILEGGTGDMVRNPSLGEAQLLRAIAPLPNIGGTNAADFVVVASNPATRRFTAFALDGRGSYLRAYNVP